MSIVLFVADAYIMAMTACGNKSLYNCLHIEGYPSYFQFSALATNAAMNINILILCEHKFSFPERNA